ncbi:MAG TPA: class I SAM-dependent methyltransferase [Solirubrobacterales bacterium]|nr:class I SAM-dependent methyltransferase [Solirubrobacterales bacterium]
MSEDVTARTAYDRYAPIYDEWNEQNNYELWLGEILLPQLQKLGLAAGGWALDVGCGTGRAFDPLLTRGWRIIGCDVSEGMLAEAKRKYGSAVRLLNLDARALPAIRPEPGLAAGSFQLVLLLNDVINYLIEDGDLEKVFEGVSRNLSAHGGLLIFDSNTLALFRDDYASGLSEEMAAKGWEWHGLTKGTQMGGLFEARLSGRGVASHIHKQRHWTREQIELALEASGLDAIAVLGQREEDQIVLSECPSEIRDEKAIYVAVRHPGCREA